ncbi:expressed unknown protein [Seminavis robusta]|uniref:Uncharacterized protein n=1 Tax=Seminavis robusta TaxID=568900 RepID=A0A9N8DZE1_9STRA|nr:expressed unknown protein [Seminavis robusta]|eukprot:Sro411_g137690.1 n/a (440) ;mRNA; r:41594-42913
MVDSVLSPNRSVPNQVLGEKISSPNGFGNGKGAELPMKSNENIVADVPPGEDKENGAVMQVNTTEEVAMDSEDPNPSPKRDADALSGEEEESPRLDKRPRKSFDDTATVNTQTETVTSQSTSSTKSSVEVVLADLAKAKELLEESKSTLTLLREHQQKLATNGCGMKERIAAFDQELSNLKETHVANGKELDKVLAIRDSAKELFVKAAGMLKQIGDNRRNSTTDKDKPKESVESPVIADNVKEEDELTVAEVTPVETDKEKQEETTIEAEVSEEATVEAIDEQELDELTTVLVPTTACEDLPEEEKSFKEDDKAEKDEMEVPSEEPPQKEEEEETIEMTGISVEKVTEAEGEEETKEPLVGTDTDAIKGLDQEEAPSFDEGANKCGTDGTEDDQKMETCPSNDTSCKSSNTASIDDTLALELQNGASSDSEDDSLISM